MEDFLVTINHVRAVRHNGEALCARGIRGWCSKVGVDYSKLLRDGGIPASELSMIDDHYARLVVATARQIHEASR